MRVLKPVRQAVAHFISRLHPSIKKGFPFYEASMGIYHSRKPYFPEKRRRRELEGLHSLGEGYNMDYIMLAHDRLPIILE